MSIRKNNKGGPGWHVLNDEGREIAWVFEQGKPDGPHNEDNARLYDAAPDLLDILKELVDACDGNYREITDEAKTLIQKITIS